MYGIEYRSQDWVDQTRRRRDTAHPDEEVAGTSNELLVVVHYDPVSVADIRRQ
jgi:hypothetical protein